MKSQNYIQGMRAKIGTACFNGISGYKLIYSPDNNQTWIRDIQDNRHLYGKLYDHKAGKSIILLSPCSSGIFIIVSKIVPNRCGDNISVYLHIPNGALIDGNIITGFVYDSIAALESNRKDNIERCLNEISSLEYDINSLADFPSALTHSGNAVKQIKSRELPLIFGNLFQDLYYKYQYIFLAIDGQGIVNDKDVENISDKVISQKVYVSSDSNVKVRVEKNVAKQNLRMNEEVKENKLEQGPTNKGEGFVYTSEWLKANTSIHGWLSVFLFSIIIGGLINAISIVNYKAEDSYYDGFDMAFAIIICLSMFCIAAYTVYAFINRTPNAIFYGRFYVIMELMTNMMSIGDADDNETIIYVVVWSIVCCLWLLYLFFSNQVQEVIPKPFRRVSGLDRTVLGFILTVPFICIFIGIVLLDGVFDDEGTRDTTSMNIGLLENEKTDGKVIFSIPEGFDCQFEELETEDNEPFILYTLENESGVNCTLFSDHDTDTSISNFEDHWNNWIDSDTEKITYYDVDRGIKTYNGNMCRYKIVKYNYDGVMVYWRYYVMFNTKTGNCCIVSFYDRNDEISYVEEILNSIRLK